MQDFTRKLRQRRETDTSRHTRTVFSISALLWTRKLSVSVSVLLKIYSPVIGKTPTGFSPFPSTQWINFIVHSIFPSPHPLLSNWKFYRQNLFAVSSPHFINQIDPVIPLLTHLTGWQFHCEWSHLVMVIEAWGVRSGVRTASALGLSAKSQSPPFLPSASRPSRTQPSHQTPR